MLDDVSMLMLKSNSANEALDYVLTRFMEEHCFKIGVVVQFKNGKGKISHYINHGYSNTLLATIESLIIDDITNLAGQTEKNIFIHQTPFKMNRRLIDLYYLLEENNLEFGLTCLFRTDDGVWGALHFWHTEKLHFSEDEFIKYDLMNRIIALALENHNLKVNPNGAYAAKQINLSAPNLMPVNGTQNKTLYDVLTDALNQVLATLNLKSGSVYLIDEHEEFAELITYSGMPLEYVKQLEFLSIANPSVASVIHAGQSLVTVELAFKNQEMYNLQQKHGIKRLVSVPLRARNQILGFVNLAVSPFRNFERSEIYFLDSFGRQLGLLVENSRLTTRTPYYATALPA